MWKVTTEQQQRGRQQQKDGEDEVLEKEKESGKGRERNTEEDAEKEEREEGCPNCKRRVVKKGVFVESAELGGIIVATNQPRKKLTKNTKKERMITHAIDVENMRNRIVYIWELEKNKDEGEEEIDYKQK